jgi:hypothetical protein
MQEMEDTDIGNKQIKKEPTMNKQAVLAVLEFLRRNNLKVCNFIKLVLSLSLLFKVDLL